MRKRTPPAPLHGGRPVVPAGLLRLHRHGLVNVLVIARDPALRLVCATEFHRASPLRGGALVRVDGAAEEDLLMRALLAWSAPAADQTGVHPLWPAAHGTLALDHVTRLSPAAQKLLYELVCRDRDGERHAGAPWCGRLIAMCDEPPEDSVARGEFSAELLDCLDKVRVAPPEHVHCGAA